jgi:putative transposase
MKGVDMPNWPLRGFASACQRVARLMRTAQPQGVSRRKLRTTIRDEVARPAPDVVDRQFTTAGPDRLWASDITYSRESS